MASTALLAGCAYFPVDGREFEVAGQSAAVSGSDDKQGIEIAKLDVAPAAQLGDHDPEIAPGRQIASAETAGTVEEDSDDGFFDADWIDSENYPSEAASLTEKDNSLRVQFASLQQVSDISEEGADEYDGDFFEPMNRFFFAINETLDTFILRPVAVTYNFWVPQGVRNSVRNFLRNLRTPIILANDLFQGDTRRAEATAARFLINTTVGLGGLFDIAADEGWDYHNEDFGQTLAVHGFGEGSYLVIPLVGPSSVRDGIGMIADLFLDPLTYIAPWEVRMARYGATAVDFRSRTYELTDELKRDSIDYYARIRSFYGQQREHEIANGREGEGPGGETDIRRR